MSAFQARFFCIILYKRKHVPVAAHIFFPFLLGELSIFPDMFKIHCYWFSIISKQNNPTGNKALKIHGTATEKEVFSVLKMTLLNKSDSTEKCTSPLLFQKKSRE